MPDGAAVRLVGISRFFGSLPALEEVDLTVPAGAVALLLGPNGAGKTTLLRILATLTRPDGGQAWVAGHDVVRDPTGVRRQIGLVAHRPLLYPDLTALENLRFYARLYGVPAGSGRLRQLLSEVGLWHRRHDRVRTFSRGMSQRLAIVRAVLHDPAVLLLDEPHSGLDPAAARELDEVLGLMVAQGRTVVMASHDLERAYRLADCLAILHRGRIAWQGGCAEVATGELPALYAALTGEDPPSRGGDPPPVLASARGRRGKAGPGGPQKERGQAVGGAGAGPRVWMGTAASRPASLAGASWAIAWKDLLLELHAREILAPVAVFALLVMVLFHFALPVEAARRDIAPGALWVALLFGSTLGLSRALGSEVDSGGMTGLLVSPIDRGALFAGKWLAGYLFTCLVAVFLLPAAVALLSLPTAHLPALAAVMLLGLIGWVAAGTLLGAMAVSTRAREVLLPVLLYPLVVPLLVPALQASVSVLAGRSLGLVAGSLVLVAAYDVIFVVLGFLLFSYTVEG